MAVLLAVSMVVSVVPAGLSLDLSSTDPNDPGLLEPVLTKKTGEEHRAPFTDQVKDGELANLVSFSEQDALGATSLRGHNITKVSNPHNDLRNALGNLADHAQNSDGEITAAMTAEAVEIENILLGETEGRIYDGFRLLNFNKEEPTAEHLPGQYKTKRLQDSGETATGIEGENRTIWETTVNMFWYGQSFDADTFLIRVPAEAHANDLLRINWRIYSLTDEDLAPMTAMKDQKTSVQFPWKGQDAVWQNISNDAVAEASVDHGTVGQIFGVYTWGWRVHPPRIQFVQLIDETFNETGERVLTPSAKSWQNRTRNLPLSDVSDHAPEKKAYEVAQAVIDETATADEIHAMLTDANTDPSRTYNDWVDLMEDKQQLPPEARERLESEAGVSDGGFGPYRFASAFMNFEMYGNGPDGPTTIQGWSQGETTTVKVYNLDNTTHYYRNVDFGPRLHDDVRSTQPAGRHSFEIHNLKPSYGAPKVAEMQFRAGWGFRPHNDVIQQFDVFSRDVDQENLTTYTDGEGDVKEGYLYSEDHRVNTWRFNPPKHVIGTEDDPSTFRLKGSDGQDGIRLGTHTEGYGVGKMCDNTDAPPDEFCPQDFSDAHPTGAVNVDTDGDGEKDALKFPPFLRNPADDGGDIIPPTPLWKPFLFLNPDDGTLDARTGDGFRVDETYAHGRPIPADGEITADIEQPRSAAQVFYQFDPLYHDNNIFSPHTTADG